jgi:dTDP-4-dehydrorhamnose 3,5-epimerase
MRVTPTTIPDVLLLEPRVHGDERGFFLESWNRDNFRAATDMDPVFVQDNHSRSSRGVLRGLHYQLPPHAQGKLVRVTQGAVFDVVVDIRRSSPSFGRWVGAELSGANHQQLWIPPGFAHGFLVLSESADFLYKTTDFYAPECDRSIRFDDPDLAIVWPAGVAAPTVSARDLAAPPFARAETFE